MSEKSQEDDIQSEDISHVFSSFELDDSKKIIAELASQTNIPKFPLLNSPHQILSPEGIERRLNSSAKNQPSLLSSLDVQKLSNNRNLFKSLSAASENRNNMNQPSHALTFQNQNKLVSKMQPTRLGTMTPLLKSIPTDYEHAPEKLATHLMVPDKGPPRKSVSFPHVYDNESLSGVKSHLLDQVRSNPEMWMRSQSKTKAARASRYGPDVLASIKQSENKVKASKRALEIIQDKAFHRSTDTVKKHSKREFVPKLVVVLKKHAGLEDASFDDDNRLFQVVTQLKKLNMSVIERTKLKLATLYGKILRKLQEPNKWKKNLTKPFKPDSFFMSFWYFVMVAFILLDLVLLPFKLSFSDAFQQAQEAFNILEIVQTIFFLVDIVLNCNTAYYLDGILDMDRLNIAVKYLKGGFWLDLFASFPYDWVMDSVGLEANNFPRPKDSSLPQPVNIFRAIKLVRVIRVVKLKWLLRKLQDLTYMNLLLNGIQSLVKLGLIISLLSHWSACGWHYLALGDEQTTWLKYNGLDDEGPYDRYIASLYFAVTTMLTVGYGDISARNPGEQVYAIVIMVMGGGVFGYTMSGIAMILQSLETEKTKTRKKISIFTRYMHRKGLSSDLQDEAKKYLEFAFEDEDAMNLTEKEMFLTLSNDLQEKVYEHLNGKLLYEKKVLFESFSKKMLYHISAKVEGRTYVPEEKVFEMGNSEHCIYFIAKGQIDLYFPKAEKPCHSMGKGDHFGEYSFFTNLSPNHYAKSREFTHLLFLSRNQFLESLVKFPLDREMFCMLRDKVTIYQDYSVLHLTCFVCHSSDHTVETCPKLQFKPDKTAVINFYLAEEDKFRINFARKDRKRHHAREDLYEKALKTQDIIVKYPQEVEQVMEFLLTESKQALDEESVENNGSSFAHRKTLESKKSALQSVGRVLGLRSISKVKRDKKKKMILYHPTVGELEVIVKEGLDKEENGEVLHSYREIGARDRDLSNIFDSGRNFEVYFPHNNLKKILERSKARGRMINGQDEIQKLRRHLRRFFKALEKERARSSKMIGSLNKSISSMRMFSNADDSPKTPKTHKA